MHLCLVLTVDKTDAAHEVVHTHARALMFASVRDLASHKAWLELPTTTVFSHCLPEAQCKA